TATGLCLLRLLLGNFLMDRLHVERADLLDDAFQAFGRQRARLREHDDFLAHQHYVRNGADVERAGDLLLLVGVDLAEDDVGMLARHGVEHRPEAPARATPWRPEVEDHNATLADDLLESIPGDFDGGHEVSALRGTRIVARKGARSGARCMTPVT